MSIDKLFDKFKKENPEFPLYILEKAKEYLPSPIKDGVVSSILDNIKSEYEESLVSANEAIGIIAAQSVGAEATQMTLNTFHFAGISSQGVQGLPRLIEILDAKKNISTPIMKIYLKQKGMNDKKFKLVADKIKETHLIEFASNVDIDLENKKVKIDLNVARLKKLKVDVDSLISYMDKRIRKSCSIEESKRVIVKASGSVTLKDLMAYKEMALNSTVFGIKGIIDVSLVKEGDDFLIITKGVALKQVVNVAEVDVSRVYCNNFHAVNDILGIEAARKVIITELMEVVKSQGLTINERHVLLIADIMTYTGEIKGMTRYGIVGDKQNVLTRASFETPLKHLSLGALQGESNELNTITENVMTNQIVRVGTGLPKIAVKK